MSQVPGAPPKPTISERAAQTLREKPVSLAEKKRPLPPVLVPFKRLLFGWGVGAALCILAIGGLYFRSWAALPPHLEALLEETYFHGEILTAPAINNEETALLYVRTVETGAGVFLVNLATLERTQIALGKAADRARSGSIKLFGWSPDDRYLAFSTIEDGNENRHVVICDGAIGKEIASFKASQPVETGTWLTGDSLVVLGNSRNSPRLSLFNVEPDNHLGQFGKKGLVQLRQLDHPASSLLADSDHSISFIEQGNIWRFDVPTDQLIQLTHLTNFTLEGLDYSAAQHAYLFGAVQAHSRDTMLYECYIRATDTPPVPLSCTNYEFKGQWLEDGMGVAYVGKEGNRNYLAVATQEKELCTNLFTAPKVLSTNWGRLTENDFREGREVVRSFSVSPKMDKIYTVASVNYEPLGIWEYDIASHKQRNVVPVKERLVFSQFIAPVEASLTTSSGQKIDYYYLPPARLDRNKKYPVMMDVFSDLGFQASSQFLANSGIMFVAVHPYGGGSPRQPTEAEDMAAVYNEVLKNPNVDPHRIYISGESAGTYTIARLLEDHPDFWRGAILLSPETFHAMRAETKMVPSIFISIGTQDDSSDSQDVGKYALEACRHLTLTQIQYGNAGHVFFAIDENKKRYMGIAKFILENR
jgi:hypothetical protein